MVEKNKDKSGSKDQQKLEAATSPAPVDHYMPEGYSDADFSVVGGFTPMYKPKNAFEQKLAPVFGWLLYTEALPVISDPKGKEKDRVPLALHVLLCAPNKGWLGPDGEEIEKEIPVNEEILVPCSGNILFNRPLMTAAFDPERVWLVRMSVVDQQKSDYPTPMWVWKVEIANKPRKRSDFPRLANIQTALIPDVARYFDKKVIQALPPSAFARGVPMIGQGNGVTSSGEIYDSNGEIVSALVGGKPAAAPAA